MIKPIVWVSWVDSATIARGEWIGVDDPSIRPSACVASGFLISSEPTYIAIAGQLDSDGHAGNVIAIPRACIVAMKVWTTEAAA